MKAPLFIAVMALSSCTGFQYLAFNPDGTPKGVVQVDATLSEGEGSAREITLPNGVAIRSVQQRYDGTRVAGQILDAGTARLGLKISGSNDKITRTFDGKSKLKGTKDPNLIPVDPNVVPENPNIIPVNPN
jgi:hypothetical protein